MSNPARFPNSIADDFTRGIAVAISIIGAGAIVVLVAVAGVPPSLLAMPRAALLPTAPQLPHPQNREWYPSGGYGRPKHRRLKPQK